MPDTEFKPMSSAFSKPPRQAAEFRAKYEQSAAGQAVVSRPVDVRQGQMSRDPRLEREYQPEPDQTYQPPQPSAQEPQGANDAGSRERAVARRLLAERQAMQERIKALEERNAKFEEAYQEAARKQAEAQFAQSLAESPDLQDLDTVDAEDAQKIASVAARAVGGQISALQQELLRQREERQEAAQKYRAKVQAAQERKRALSIMKDHPDFFDLYKDPNFVEYINGRDGYSSKTRGDLAFEEFQRGNTAYVKDFLARFKEGRSAGNFRSVAPVQVAGGGGTAYGGSRGKPRVNYTLREINDLFQMRRIDQDQYRAMLNDLRAANA